MNIGSSKSVVRSRYKDAKANNNTMFGNRGQSHDATNGGYLSRTIVINDESKIQNK